MWTGKPKADHSTSHPVTAQHPTELGTYDCIRIVFLTRLTIVDTVTSGGIPTKQEPIWPNPTCPASGASDCGLEAFSSLASLKAVGEATCVPSCDLLIPTPPKKKKN